jgi:hypothetical protein
MNESIREVLVSEGIQIMAEKCCACGNNFIDINHNDLWNLYQKKVKENKYAVSKDILFYCGASHGLYCGDKVECFTCKNNVCRGCMLRIADCCGEDWDDYDGSKESMEALYIICCPICKTNGFWEKPQETEIVRTPSAKQDSVAETS